MEDKVFLSLALDGDEWSHSFPFYFVPEETVPLHR